MPFITKGLFTKALQNSLNNVLESCYNVYVNECIDKKIVPMSADDFGKAVDTDLKIQQLNRKVSK